MGLLPKAPHSYLVNVFIEEPLPLHSDQAHYSWAQPTDQWGNGCLKLGTRTFLNFLGILRLAVQCSDKFWILFNDLSYVDCFAMYVMYVISFLADELKPCRPSVNYAIKSIFGFECGSEIRDSIFYRSVRPITGKPDFSGYRQHTMGPDLKKWITRPSNIVISPNKKA